MLRGGLGHEEEPEEEHDQQHPHDHVEAYERVYAGSPRGAQTEHQLQDAKCLGRIQVGRPDVLVAGIAGGR